MRKYIRWMRWKLKKIRKGFTLAELLVVIGILVALVGVLLPVLFGISERARVARVGVDMLEILNASLKHFDDTGSIPDFWPTDNPNYTPPCAKLEFSSLITDNGMGGWLGPYLDKELGMSPFGTPYWLCSKILDGVTEDWINGMGACTPGVVTAPFNAKIYAFMVTIDINHLAPLARQRIARAIDKAIDGRVSGTTGKVRYPSDPTGICIGFLAGAQ